MTLYVATDQRVVGAVNGRLIGPRHVLAGYAPQPHGLDDFVTACGLTLPWAGSRMASEPLWLHSPSRCGDCLPRLIEILAARVDPREQYASAPRLEVLVDHLPRQDEYTYATVSARGAGRVAYFGEIDGIVDFFVHDPSDERGFGGAVFTPRLHDGTQPSVRGPWSSNGAAMEAWFGRQTVAVSITDDPAAFERGYTFTAGHLTASRALEALALTDTPGRWAIRRGFGNHFEIVEEVPNA